MKKNYIAVVVVFFSILLLVRHASAFTLSDGLVAHWAFDDGEGMAMDSSGNGNDLTFHAPATWTAGENGGAISFDGSPNYARIDPFNNIPASTMTICGWIKTTGTDETILEFGRNPSSNVNEGMLRIDSNGKLQFWDYSTSAYGFPLNASSSSNMAVNDGNWHLACFIKNGFSGDYYIDGLKSGFTAAASDVTYGSNDWVVGGDYRDNGYFFNGQMDDFRVYNRVLSPTEIANLYDLIGHWKFDDGEGSTAADSSGYGNSGTLVNGPSWVYGKLNDGLSFDGSTSYVEIPDAPILEVSSSITVSAWVFAGNFSQSAMFVTKNPVNTDWQLFAETGPSGEGSGGIKWRSGSSTPGLAAPFPTGGQWHQVVASQSGTLATLYIDGAVVASGTVGALGTDPGTIDIGRFDNDFYFNGKIDDVRIYSRALTDNQVATLYNTTNPFSGGTGSSDDPFQITACSELETIDWHLSSNYILENDLDCSSYGYRATVGSLDTPFIGTFNGNGHTITLSLQNQNVFQAGLFRATSGATIEQLRIAGTVMGRYYVGAIVGKADNGTILNKVANTAEVSGTGDYVGGIVGDLSGNSTIENAYNIGSVTAYSRIGGVVGYLENNSTITNSYSRGAVHGVNFIGGLVGQINNSGSPSFIRHSFSVGAVSGSNTGGLVGSILVASEDSLDTDFWDVGRSLINICSHDNSGYYGPVADVCDSVNDNFSAPLYFKNNFVNSPLNTWDTSTIWGPVAGGYPVLLAFPEDGVAVNDNAANPLYYWYKTGADSNWDTLSGNWWDDIDHTIQSAHLPPGNASVITLGSTPPTADPSVWTQPALIDATATGIIFNSDTQATESVPITGDATFYGSSGATGHITGNVTFYENSFGQSATISGNAIFNGNSFDQYSTIQGDATFNTIYYSGTPPEEGVFVFNNDSWITTVNGTIFGSDAAPITHFIFNSHQNLGIINVTTTFNNGSTNQNIINGNVIFNDHSLNNYYITGNVIFNNTSYNNSIITGSSTFNQSSYNDSEITGNATFNNISKNNANVDGDAYFSCGTSDNGYVGGTITHQSCALIGAFESAEVDTSPSSPGATTSDRFLFEADQNYLTTAISQTQDGYDSQVFKFQPDLDGISNPNFIASWTGHGDINSETTSLSIWNNDSSSWEELSASTSCGDDCTLSGAKSGANYLDGDNFVWLLTKAYNYYNPPFSINVSDNSGLLPITWDSVDSNSNSISTTAYLAYDTVSHASDSWDDYANHATSTDLATLHSFSPSLSNGTTYYYRVRSVNVSGDFSTDTTEYSFTYSTGSSCPFLFTYDGTKYNFITDLSPAAIISTGLDRATWAATPFYKDPSTANNFPDPLSFSKIPHGSLVPRTDGGQTYYDIKTDTQLNEVNYYDNATLEIIDHDAGVDVYPDWRNNGQLHTVRTDAPAPVAVVDQSGNDLSAYTAHNDNLYWHSSTSTSPAYIQIKLANGTTTPAHLKLLMTAGKEGAFTGGKSVDGVQYKNADGRFVALPTSTDFINVTRAGAPHISRNLFSTYGVMTKVIDLSGLTIKDNTIRIIVTNNKRIWDLGWLVVDTSTDSNFTITTETPYFADLHLHGISALVPSVPSDPSMHLTQPDYYNLISTQGRGNPLTGFATKYGDVLPLLTSVDNKFAIMVQGDELSLKYHVPAQADGTVRDFVYSTWDYHKPFSGALGDTISLLPFNEMTQYPYHTNIENYPTSTEYQIYQNTYNTRVIDWSDDDLNPFAIEHHSANTDLVTLSVEDLGGGFSLSLISSTPWITTSTITWSSGSTAASSKVVYSPDTSYASSTSETDTGTRVTSHTKVLSNLVSCASYHYKVVSTDGSSTTVTSTDHTFTTGGCSGNASVSSATSTSNNVSTTSTASLTDSSNTITVTAPANFTATTSQITIQIKALDSSTVLGSIGKPNGSLNSAASVVFDVKALIDSQTTLDSFDLPVTITYHYFDSDISGLNESSLWMYHYHNGVWLALDNCTVNTVDNIITCTAPSFSTFALFGSPTQQYSGGGSSGYVPVSHTTTTTSIITTTTTLTVMPKIISPIVAPENQLACADVLYLKHSVKYGAKNNVDDVKLLQKFLNTYEGTNLSVDGKYKKIDYAAIVKWQEKYSDEILKPWGLKKGTGYVYVTSLKKIKQIHSAGCAEEIGKPVFSRDLKVGSVGDDVKQLQIFLNTHGFIIAKKGPGSPGNETTKFGASTKSALIKFQEANKDIILKPFKFSKGTGLFKGVTRETISGLLEN